MSLDATQLYALLPAVYRTQDAQNGYPLQALIQVLASQSDIVEENIQQLYDDEFIETCASWVIPYIGDLIGSNPIYEISGTATGTRAEVANTIGYRRRKGTVLALEQVCMDVSGMPAAAVEFFKRLITTESMRHVRPHHAATANLRHGSQLERINTAFDTLNRTVDVRRIAPRVRSVPDPDTAPLDVSLHGGGRCNIPDMGIYLWRWQYFSVIQAPAFPVDDRRYMFSPLGQDMPLFNVQAPRDSFSRLTTRMDVSQPIGRREMFENLEQFYSQTGSIQLFQNGAFIEATEICVGNLSDGPGQTWGCTPSGKIAIDPVLGRIQLGADVAVPEQLQVGYYYGFPDEIGGGPYDRTPNLPALAPSQFNYVAVVGSVETPDLETAVANWNLQPSSAQGLIVLPGFTSLDINLTGAAAITLPAESQLWIVSAQVHTSGTDNFTYEGSCATLRGNIAVVGQRGSGATVPPAGQLSISGVWIAGSLTVSGDAANVQLLDSTLVPGISLTRSGQPVAPGEPSIIATAGEVNLSVVNSISGPIGVSEGGTTRICSSIVDAGFRGNVAYAGSDFSSEGADLHIEDSTVIGKVRVRTMELASNTIFLACLPRNDSWNAALWCSRQQAGCMRFCFLPSSAITPQRFRCLPDVVGQEGLLLPQFVTLRYGHPSYALLGGDTPMAIWTGADDGGQMGVYNGKQETQAIRNVQLRAPEYLPFELESGIVLVPSHAIVERSQDVGGYGAVRNTCNPCRDDEDEDLRFVGVGASLI